MGAEQAYFIKGYLLDKDPPQLVTDALDDIIDALKNARPASHEILQQQFVGAKAIFTEPQNSALLTALEGETHPEEEEREEIAAQEEEEQIEESLNEPVKKKHRKWTFEDKCDLVRLRDAGKSFKEIEQATGLKAASATTMWYELKRKNELDQYRGTKKPAPVEAVEYRPVEADKLIEDHGEFAGEREDGLLQDHDWGDIKRQLMSGDDQATIAMRYGCSEASMNRFVTRMQQPGVKAGEPRNADLNKMKLMRKRGKTDEEIAAEMNINLTTVRVLLREEKKKPQKAFSFGNYTPARAESIEELSEEPNF